MDDQSSETFDDRVKKAAEKRRENMRLWAVDRLKQLMKLKIGEEAEEYIGPTLLAGVVKPQVIGRIGTHHFTVCPVDSTKLMYVKYVKSPHAVMLLVNGFIETLADVEDRILDAMGQNFWKAPINWDLDAVADQPGVWSRSEAEYHAPEAEDEAW